MQPVIVQHADRYRVPDVLFSQSLAVGTSKHGEREFEQKCNQLMINRYDDASVVFSDCSRWVSSYSTTSFKINE
jgi:hypothetical protein